MLNYQFSNDVMVDSYDTCDFYFPPNLHEIWTTQALPSDDSTHRYHTAVTVIPKVNLEYSSPLVDGVFPEKGCFMIQNINAGLEGQPGTVLNKIFIPVGCTLVTLTRTSDNSRCTISIPTLDSQYANLVTFYSGEGLDEAPEVEYHRGNHDDSVSGFYIKPHELQVNGSELFQRFHDYYETGRSSYISNLGLQLPEYSGFSLARNFSKFFLGGQVK